MMSSSKEAGEPVDLDEIELATRYASPGPWVAKVTDGGTDIESSPTNMVVCTLLHGDSMDAEDEGNLDYLRQLDPTTVRALVRLARIGQKIEAIAAEPLSTGAPAGDSWGTFETWCKGQRLSLGSSPEATAAEAAWNAAMITATRIATAASRAEPTVERYALLLQTELEALVTDLGDTL